MPDPNAPLKLGATCWNQYTDWPEVLAAQQRADRLGYDSLWRTARRSAVTVARSRAPRAWARR
jgi:hypothetical protein